MILVEFNANRREQCLWIWMHFWDSMRLSMYHYLLVRTFMHESWQMIALFVDYFELVCMNEYAHLNHVHNQCISLLLYMCAYMQFIWCIQMFLYGSNNWKHPTQMAASNAISIWNANTNTSYKIDGNMNYFIIQNMQLCRFQNDAHFNPLTCFIYK